MTMIIGTLTLNKDPAQIQFVSFENVDYQMTGSGEDIVQFIGRTTPGIKLSGKTINTDVDDFWVQKEREEPILINGGALISDVWSGGQVYAKIISFTPEIGPGASGYRNYASSVAILGNAATYSRCSVYDPVKIFNNFSNDGKVRVDLPVGATGASESTTYTRTISGGNTIAICELSNKQPFIKYTVTEANLALGNVVLTERQKDQYWCNDLIMHRSRLEGALANPGRFTLYYYSAGTTLDAIATLSISCKSTAGTLESFDDKYPVVEDFWGPGSHKQFGSMWFDYPSSASEYYRMSGKLWMWRGKPTWKLVLKNEDETTKGEIRVKLLTDSTAFRYLTFSGGTTYDATASAYGELLATADTDVTQYAVLHTESSLTSNICLQLGLFTGKQANRDFRATDAGNYWSDLSVALDNLSVTENLELPPVWVFTQRYSNTQTSPAELVNEAMVEPRVYQTVRKGVT